MQIELALPIREAFHALHADLSAGTWYGREREVVSLFVLAHLLPRLVAPLGSLHASQLGIEVAVPQIPTPGHRRVRPDVCKDVVIWPSPRMTCWRSPRENVQYPSVILEWKTRNNTWPRTSLLNFERAHGRNVAWLQKFVRVAPESFVGYAVMLDLVPTTPALRVVEVTSERTNESWLSLDIV